MEWDWVASRELNLRRERLPGLLQRHHSQWYHSGLSGQLLLPLSYSCNCWVPLTHWRNLPNWLQKWRRLLCRQNVRQRRVQEHRCRWLLPLLERLTQALLLSEQRLWDVGPSHWKGMGQDQSQLRKHCGWMVQLSSESSHWCPLLPH